MQINLFNIDCQQILKNINDFINSIPRLNSLHSAVSYLLNISNQFPNAVYSCYYHLNLLSYEFEHNLTLPMQYESESLEAFEHLTNEGFIGSSVAERSISIDNENSFQRIFIVSPLISFDNIVGLLIIAVNDKIIDDYNNNGFVLNFICNQFANKIENILLIEKIIEFEKTLEQKIAERTMNLLKSKAEMHEKFAELRNNLTMSLPHEIRTPIGMIMGNTDMLVKYLNDLSKEDIFEIANDISNSAKRINHLFENYIYFSNLELTAIDPIALEKLQKEELHYSNILIQDISMNKALNYNRASDLKINLVEAPIKFSEKHFLKMISELIDNAFKYSNKDNLVLIESYLSDNRFILSITDHGRGLTKEQIDSIDAYIQFDRRTHEQQGIGLGLAIARRIADLHDCNFLIESEYGSFLKISIGIPLA